VLGAGGAQQPDALAVHQHHRAHVQLQLQVEPLRRDLRERRAEADAGVVDEHVEAAEALAVRGDDALDVGLVAKVRRDQLDRVAGLEQAGGGLPQLRLTAGRQRKAVALGREQLGDREPDPARGAGHDRRAGAHAGPPPRVSASARVASSSTRSPEVLRKGSSLSPASARR
jgi:hypothetical protein